MPNGSFLELSIIVTATILVCSVVRLFKQPLIIGYILTGIILSPNLLNLISNTHNLETFAQIGITILLFTVGLHLDPSVIKDVGKVSTITGLGQILFTTIIGFSLSLAFGFDYLNSIYIAIALTFSSTIIITKLLSDKGDTDKLYGKIAIGFLIIQDIVAAIILMGLSSFASAELTNGKGVEIFLILGKALILIIFLFYISKHILPKIIRYFANSQEFLLLFSLGWCMLLASLFKITGFSMEIGALIAGVTLSASDFRFEISSKVKPLRDFFLVIFFIQLGANMSFSNLDGLLLPVIVFSLFIIVGNPIIVMLLMGWLGFTKRNGFLAGLTVAQISEFSLILIALGISVKHVEPRIGTLMTLIGIITIATSSYMIIYANQLYTFLSKYLTFFEFKNRHLHLNENTTEDIELILFGYNRIGFDILNSLNKKNVSYLVVDYDPKVISLLKQKGINCIYGDADDIDFINELDYSKVKMIISTIPIVEVNTLLINTIKEKNSAILSLVVSHKIDDSLLLYSKGASYVVMPHFLGGMHTANLIEVNLFDIKSFDLLKQDHINYLELRKLAGHEHPSNERGYFYSRI